MRRQCNGAKRMTEASAQEERSSVRVREHRMHGRSGAGRLRGRDASEDAGMSNGKTGGIPVRRKPKVSWVKAICPRVSRPLRRGRRSYPMGNGSTFPYPSRIRWDEASNRRRRSDGCLRPSA